MTPAPLPGHLARSQDLDRLASRGEFGTLFSTIQTVELTTGAIGLALMSLNIRDGLRLTGRR